MKCINIETERGGGGVRAPRITQKFRFTRIRLLCFAKFDKTRNLFSVFIPITIHHPHQHTDSHSLPYNARGQFSCVAWALDVNVFETIDPFNVESVVFIFVAASVLLNCRPVSRMNYVFSCITALPCAECSWAEMCLLPYVHTRLQSD